MSRFILFCCFLTTPLWADIELQQSINDIYYRGDHQQAGSTTLTVNDNDFAGVSPENPVFYRFELDKGSVLADTLVDQGTDGLVVSQPIYLACEIVGNGSSTLTMPGNSVSIVRWVAGEKIIWFKVQTDSETWLQDAQGQSHAPDEDAKVSWTFGISARSTVADHADPAKNNMPFNGRNPEPLTEAEAVSTLLCLNLTNSTLALGDWQGHDLAAYEADAEIGVGVYAATIQNDIDFTGCFEIARVKDLAQVGGQFSADKENNDLSPNGDNQALLQAGLVLELSKSHGGAVLEWNIHDGTAIRFKSLEGGFSEGGAWFADNCDVFGTTRVVPESAFESNGGTLYREIDLVWDHGPSYIDPIENRQVMVGFALALPLGVSNEMPRVTWSLTMPSHAGGADTAPFDGADQQRRCQPFVRFIGEGEVLSFGDSEHDRFLPHITEPGKGYTTSLIFANNSEESQAYLLRGYDADGSSLGKFIGTLNAGENQLELASELLGNPSLSHLRLAASNDVQVTAIYQAMGQEKAPAHLHESAQTATRWLVKPGDSKLTFDAFALVNLGDRASQVSVREIDAAGNTVATSLLTSNLAPMAKLLHMFEPGTAGNTFIIQASEKSAITALRGSHDSSLIWENRALPYGF